MKVVTSLKSHKIRDLNSKQITCVRRDTSEKSFLKLGNAFPRIEQLLEDIQNHMFTQATNFLNANIKNVKSYDDFKYFFSIKGITSLTMYFKYWSAFNSGLSLPI